ncbi:MAG: redoxin domain-containing protein [Gemmatimonadota bacterium]|nr:redoxin domain-containing protein [Gemmatimonadota bacterium]
MCLRQFRSTAVYGVMITVIMLTASDPAMAQRRAPKLPQEQWVKLQELAKIPDPRDRVAAVDQFLQDEPDTPFKAHVYRLQFMSHREFTDDDDFLWDLGQRYVTAFTVLTERISESYEKNPILANMYNEVAIEFANRGNHLDGALRCGIQALALMDQKTMEGSPKVSEEQWTAGINAFRGQTLKTVGWIQSQRAAYSEAETALKDAIELLPDEGPVHYHLGQTYLAQGRKEEGAEALLMAATASRAEPAASVELQRLYREKYGAEAVSHLQTDLEAAQTRAHVARVRRVVANRLDVTGPDFTIADLEGGLVSLSDLEDKVVVVNFWATWCPPCRKEMPALQELWRKYENTVDVRFLIISVDQETEKIKPFIAQYGYTFPVYHGTAASHLFGIISIPTTLVIDKQGKVQYRHTGYHPEITDFLTWEIEALR